MPRTAAATLKRMAKRAGKTNGEFIGPKLQKEVDRRKRRHSNGTRKAA